MVLILAEYRGGVFDGLTIIAHLEVFRFFDLLFIRRPDDDRLRDTIHVAFEGHRLALHDLDIGQGFDE